ncbi:hypothetical protein VTO42DRAFT_3288 [Malbranchea cinnamomea]
MSLPPGKQYGPEGPKQSSVEGALKVRPHPKDPRRVDTQLPQTHGPGNWPQSQKDIAQSLHEFAAQISIIADLESRRDRTKKRLQMEEEDLAKMEKRQFQYPANVSRLKDSRDTLAQTLTAVEQQLQSHLKIMEQIVQNIAGAISRSSHFESLESVKKDILQSKEQADRAIHLAEDIKGELVFKLQGDVASNNKATSQILEDLRQELSHQRSLIDANSKATADLKVRVASFSTTRNTAVSATSSTPSSEDFQTLQSNQQKLWDQFENLRATGEAKDSLVSEEIEKGQSFCQHQADRINSLSQDVATLQNEIKTLRQSAAIASTPQTQIAPQKELLDIRNYLWTTLERRLAGYDEGLKALNIAVHSLQTRFNNMTSEPIVRHMVAAMESMYPFAQRDVEGLRNTSNEAMRNINQLISRVGAAEAVLEQARERELAVRDMSNVIQALKSKVEAIEEGFSAGSDKGVKYVTPEQLLAEKEKVAAEMRVFKSDLEEVEKVTATKVAEVLGKLEQREEEAKAMKQTIEQQDTQIKAMEQTIEKQDADMKTLKQQMHDLMERMEDQSNFIRNFDKRALEEVKERYEMEFQARMNGHHSSRVQSQSHESSPASETMSPVRELALLNAPTCPKSIRHPNSMHPSKKRKLNVSLHHRISRE